MSSSSENVASLPLVCGDVKDGGGLFTLFIMLELA